MAEVNLTSAAKVTAPVADTSTTATPVDQSTSTSTSTTPSASVPSSTQTGVKPTTTQSGWDYKTDKRWGKVWKTEQDIINGYHTLDEILEQKYKPTYKQMEDLQKKFKDNGIDLGQADQYINHYRELASPENPAQKVYSILKELADDPITAQELDLMVADLQEKKLARKYPGATKELREKLIAQETQTKQLQQWKSSLEQKQNEAAINTAIQTGLDNVKKLATARNFEFTDKIEVEFLNHCTKNKIPAAYMVQEFRQQYEAALDKAMEQKIKSQTLQQQQQRHKTTIPMSRVQQVAQNKPKTFEDKMRSFFNATPKPAG